MSATVARAGRAGPNWASTAARSGALVTDQTDDHQAGHPDVDRAAGGVISVGPVGGVGPGAGGALIRDHDPGSDGEGGPSRRPISGTRRSSGNRSPTMSR